MRLPPVLAMGSPERILKITGAGAQLRDLLVELLRRGKYKPMRKIRTITNYKTLSIPYRLPCPVVREPMDDRQSGL
jgi:hypothetical protein